jgi:hypothetical protein
LMATRMMRWRIIPYRTPPLVDVRTPRNEGN